MVPLKRHHRVDDINEQGVIVITASLKRRRRADYITESYNNFPSLSIISSSPKFKLLKRFGKSY